MSITLESAARLAALRDKADAVTGESSDTLAGAVDALIAGYGQGSGGDGSGDALQYATFNGGQIFRNSTSMPDDYHLVCRILGNTTSLSCSLFFAYCNASKITFNANNIPSGGFNSTSQMFAGCTKANEITLENIPFVTRNASSMFQDCTALKTINGIIDVSGISNLNNIFNKASSLKDVRFVEKSISADISFIYTASLTDESIQSIINGLADLTGGTAKTLAVHATTGAKLTDEQKSIINAKNWTLTY